MHNTESTPASIIIEQLNEPRPLPMGRKEFEEWSDRIIAGALIPGDGGDPRPLIEGQKFALANMIMHLGPTESHKPDAYFVHSLRKVVCNQIAHAIYQELKGKQQARAKAAEEAAGNVTPIGVAPAT